MSSGVVKNRYRNIPTIDLPIQALFKFDKKEGQKCKFYFISELVSMLFTQNNSQESFKIISSLIKLSLKAPEENFADVIFSGNNAGAFNNIDNEVKCFLNQKFRVDKNMCLLMLNRVRSILINCPDLTNNQKFDYCRIERYFMKSYLKEGLVKI